MDGLTFLIGCSAYHMGGHTQCPPGLFAQPFCRMDCAVYTAMRANDMYHVLTS